MKHYLQLIFCLFILAACKNAQHQSSPVIPQKEETPKALQDESSSYDLSKSRVSNNLIDELYGELLKDDTALNKLETAIVEFSETKNDSLNAFRNFDGKNQSYYQSANAHLSAIHDSVLLKEIKLAIDQSTANYQNSIAGTIALLKRIDEKTIAMEDLHLALKIVKTLPQIETWQKKNMASSKAVLSAFNTVDQIVQKEKGEIKK